MGSSNTENYKTIYISFNNILLKKWPGIYILPQFGGSHNQTPKVASNYMPRTVGLLHNMCRQVIYELFLPLTGKNISWKMRYTKEHFEAENLKKKEYWTSWKFYWFL